MHADNPSALHKQVHVASPLVELMYVACSNVYMQRIDATALYLFVSMWDSLHSANL